MYDIRLIWTDLEHICKCFPSLETTIILVAGYPNDRAVVTYTPEIDGELDFRSVRGDQRLEVAYASFIKDYLESMKHDEPTRSFPAVKLRYEGQFINVETLTVPNLEDTGKIYKSITHAHAPFVL